MHRENLDAAIAIMERAAARESVYMPAFQTAIIAHRTEAELHACGSKACFAGHVAISPEWAAAGGVVNFHGAPVMNGLGGSYAIAEWLDITFKKTRGLVDGDLADYSGNAWSRFYGKMWARVNAADVIAKLMELKNAS